MSKTLSLDENTVRRLRSEENQSELVDQLLVNYFKQKDFDGMSKEQLKTQIEIIKLEKKIKELKDG